MIKKERPVSCSVLPTSYSSVAKYESSSPKTNPSPTSPNNDFVHFKEKRSSLILSPNTNEHFKASPPKYKSSPESKEIRDVTPHEKKELAPRCLFKEEKNTENLQPPVHGYVPKSPLEDNDASRENLSATSGSLSSLSPPSSPSKLKSEQEKQEEESNEKSILGKFLFVFGFVFYRLNNLNQLQEFLSSSSKYSQNNS